MRAVSTLMAAAALAQTSMAHYCFNKLIVNGNYTGEYEYVRKNSNINSPVTDVTSKDLICNAGALETGAQTSTYTVAPGDKVGFGLDTAIGHPGPLNVYMSQAPGAASEYDGSGDWFKVYEMGVKEVTDNGLTWESDQLMNFTFTLPEETPAGQYFLRVEHIGLHGASTFEGAQFYISCAQIEVTGSGAGKPSPTVNIPGVYDGHEPGLELSIYYPIPTNYQIPGPAVWPSDGSASNSTSSSNSTVAASSAVPVASSSAAAVESSAASTVTSAAVASSSAVVPTQVAVASSAPYPIQNGTFPAGPTGFSTVVASSTAPLSTGTSSGALKKYFQCGGKNYSGATECEEGTTCKQWNEFYSQCV